MLRGELSNRPAAICGIDYQILLDVQSSYAWFVEKVPELLVSKFFERTMRRALPWRDGAKLWLEYNSDKRLVGIAVGVPLLIRALEMVLGDYLIEVYHFNSPAEFHQWIRCTPQVFRVYSNDPAMLSLDEVTQPHQGWTEKV